VTRTRGWRLDALILAGYLLALVALFWPVILGGKVLVPFDNLFTDPPWRDFAGQLGVSRPQNLMTAPAETVPWAIVLEPWTAEQPHQGSHHRKTSPDGTQNHEPLKSPWMPKRFSSPNM